MKSFVNTLAIALSTVTLLGACVGDKQSTGTKSSAPTATQETLGTGDSGGGNIYKGRPIDSYIKDITTLPAYQNRIAPIITQLLSDNADHSDLNDDDLGRMFNYIVQKKSWYFIPGELQLLSKERTGIVVTTEQGALQGRKEIWLNSNIFDSMTEGDQASLIMHEILMGIRLLKVDSGYNQCLSYTPDVSFCDNTDKRPYGDITSLTPSDYADIRATGSAILKDYTTLTYEDWEDLMGTQGFSMHWRRFHLKGDRAPIEYKDFIQKLRSAIVINYLPTNGFPGYNLQKPWPSSEACSVNFGTLDENSKTLTVKLTMGTKEQTFTMNVAQQFDYEKDYSIEGRTLISYAPAVEGGDAAKVGDHFFQVHFLMDNVYLAGVKVQELVWTDIKRDDTGHIISSTAYSVKGGLLYTCFDQKSITYSF